MKLVTKNYLDFEAEFINFLEQDEVDPSELELVKELYEIRENEQIVEIVDSDEVRTYLPISIIDYIK